MSNGVPATTIKVATISPDGSGLVDELRQAAAKIESLTEGEVRFKFYTNGSMGDDQTVKRKMRSRQLQGAIVQTAVLTNDVPNLNLYNLPLLFQSNEEVKAVRKELDPIIISDFDGSGYIPLGMIGIGLAYGISTKPFETVEDTLKLKVWAPKDDRSVEIFLRSFGLSPIPLTIVDVLPSLQTGIIDTVASPPVAAIALQWHTQVKYMLDLPILYAITVFILDERSFNKLDEETQSVIVEEMKVGINRAELDIYQDHEEALEAMIEHGIELREPRPAALADWNKFALDTHQKWLDKGLITKDSYQKLIDVLNEYRQQQNATEASSMD